MCLLGQPQFFQYGRPFRLAASRRALALVCFLMLKRRGAVSRSAATLAIWPDDDDATARAALRRELHRVAKALPEPDGEPWILADQAELRWNDRANAWLDLEAFETALSDERHVHEAVGLYRGDLLDGLEAQLTPRRSGNCSPQPAACTIMKALSGTPAGFSRKTRFAKTWFAR